MRVHTAGTRETIVIDFRSVAPAAARLDMFVDGKGEGSPQASRGYRASL
jgi:gamma-glutamyltranspeptidase